MQASLWCRRQHFSRYWWHPVETTGLSGTEHSGQFICISFPAFWFHWNIQPQGTYKSSSTPRDSVAQNGLAAAGCVWNIWRDVKLLTLVVSYSAVSWISLSLIFNTERSWFSYSAVVSIFPEHQFQQGAEGSPDVASANEAPHWMIRKTYLQFSISFLSSMATG